MESPDNMPSLLESQKKKKRSTITRITVGDVDSCVTEDEAEEQRLASLKEQLIFSKKTDLAQVILEGKITRKAFRKVLKDNLKYINVCEQELDFTPLHIAIVFRRAAYAKEILKIQKTDVNSQAVSFITPLLLACDLEYHEMVQMIMQRRDIDINLKDTEGNTPLTLALSNFDFKLINLLLTRTPQGVENTRLPKIYIEEHPLQHSYFGFLNEHRKNGVAANVAIRIGKRLLKHGCSLAKVYAELRYAQHHQLLFNSGTLTGAIIHRNPEMLGFLLQNLQGKLTPQNLIFLWKVHQKCINVRLVTRTNFDENDIEFVNGTRIAKVLSGFIKCYEGISGKDVPICVSFVGSKRGL